jgi:universal stress protein A
MLPFKRILCPTDFSEHSFKAIEAGGELARIFHAQLFLLHVIPPLPALSGPESPGSFDASRYQAALEGSAEKSLEAVKKKRLGRGVKVSALVSDGSPAREILRVAKVKRADLVVIATHGQTGLQHLFGSVADRVMRHSSVPVLIIHSRRGRK